MAEALDQQDLLAVYLWTQQRQEKKSLASGFDQRVTAWSGRKTVNTVPELPDR